jgi:DNA-binding GntR family transcriptional regulator
MTIVARTLSDQAYELIRERILSAEILPLSPIRQDALSLELGVSKVPLREALARLGQDGLIGSHPNRGFFVLPLTVVEAREVFELRLKIEPDAAAEGALGATPADQNAARAALELLEQDAKAPTSRNVALNRAFHVALVRPAGKQVTTSLIDRLHVIGERYVRKHLEPPGRDVRALREHRALFNAWMRKDTATVRKLTDSHIRSTLRDLLAQLGADPQLKSKSKGKRR